MAEIFRPAKLPDIYAFAKPAAEKDGPRVIVEALKFYGLREIVGKKHEGIILSMADSLGGQVDQWFDADEKAWCGLFVSYVAMKAGFAPLRGFDAVRARKYASWGLPVPDNAAAFGDVLVFWRGSKDGTDGHVGFYIGEDKNAFHVLGGNQGNAVSIVPIAKSRLLAVRRCPWKTVQPLGVRKYALASRGDLSHNEA